MVKLDGELGWLRLGVRDVEGRSIDHPGLRRDLLVPMLARPAPDTPRAPIVDREPFTLAGRVVETDVHFVNAGMVDGPVVRTWRPRAPIEGLYFVDGVLRVRDASGGDGVAVVEVLEVRRGTATAGGALPEDATVWFEPGQWYVTYETAGRQRPCVYHHQLVGRGGEVVDVASEEPMKPLPDPTPPGVATFEVRGQRYALPPRVTDVPDDLGGWGMVSLLVDFSRPARYPHLDGFLVEEREEIVAEGRY